MKINHGSYVDLEIAEINTNSDSTLTGRLKVRVVSNGFDNTSFQYFEDDVDDFDLHAEERFHKMVIEMRRTLTGQYGFSAVDNIAHKFLQFVTYNK